jgi:DNA topoisomerase-1
MIVNDLLVEYFPDLISIDFTARLEDDLDEIAGGRPWVPVIQGFYDVFETELKEADEAIPKLNLQKEVEPVGRDCPQCGSPLVYRDGKYGRFIGCGNFPACRYTEQILNTIGIFCPVGGGEVVERRTRNGRIWYSCSRYPECEWTSWKKPVAAAGDCDGLIVRGNGDKTECLACGLKDQLSAVSGQLSAGG